MRIISFLDQEVVLLFFSRILYKGKYILFIKVNMISDTSKNNIKRINAVITEAGRDLTERIIYETLGKAFQGQNNK